MRLVFAIWYRRMSDRLKTDRLFAGSTTLGFCTADLLSWALKGRDRPLGKKSGRPCGDGSARFFFSRVGFACRVQSDFLVCEPGKLDDSPLLRAFFWTLFLGCEEPTAVARARTSRDTRAHRRRTNERGFSAVVSRSHRPGGSRIRRYRASPTRVDGPPRRLKAFTPRNPSVSGCPSLFHVPLAPPRPSRRGRRIRRPSPISADGRGGRGRVQAVAGAGSRTPRVGLPVRGGDPVGQPAGPCRTRSRIKKDLAQKSSR